MKKGKIFIAAVLSAAVLSSCGGSSDSFDISKTYKDYFKYAFGKDSEVSRMKSCVMMKGTDDEHRHDEWYIRYENDVTYMTACEIIMDEYIDNDAADYSSAEEKYNSIVFDAAANEICKTAGNDLAYKVARDLFEFDTLSEEAIAKGEGYELDMGFISAISGSDGNEAMVRERISPGTGYTVYDADLFRAAVNKEFGADIVLTIDEDADKDEFLTAFREFEKAYEEYVVVPMNYRFTMQKKIGDDETETLYESVMIAGEMVDDSIVKSSDFDYHKMLWDNLS